MTILALNLMLGPLILVLAFLYKRFPPKKINHIYGYRTPRSMKSQEAWDCANRYSSNALVVMAVLICFVQAVLWSLLPPNDAILWTTGVLVVGVIAVIPLTEVHLKKSGF
ncbi:MAG: SdpI family protein [Cyclobacteriaceae bacterium]|nr:SdpI family protein [Cyclobacteriaceae bacterium]